MDYKSKSGINGIRTRGLFFNINICIQGYPKGTQRTLTSNFLIFAGYESLHYGSKRREYLFGLCNTSETNQWICNLTITSISTAIKGSCFSQLSQIVLILGGLPCYWQAIKYSLFCLVTFWYSVLKVWLISKAHIKVDPDNAALQVPTLCSASYLLSLPVTENTCQEHSLSDFFLYMPHGGEVNIYTSHLIEFIKYILLNNILYYIFLV